MTARDISKRASSRKAAKPWRDVIKIDPAALQYPRLGEAELAELGADIATRGLQVNVVLIREGGEDLLLDGISRLDALETNGVNLVAGNHLDPTLGLGGGSRVRVVTGVDPYALAASLNAHRRHLTPEQKRARIEALIKQNPEKSDRRIAEEAKTDHKVVGRARKRLEATGAAPQLKKRTGTDGKARKRPRRRSSSKPPAVGNVPTLNQASADAVNSGGERTKAAVFAPDTRPENGELELQLLAYLNATCEQRQQFLTGIGIDRLLNDLPADMLAELHKRLVAQYRGAAPEKPLNPTEAALAQVADDRILEFLRRTKH